MYTMDLCFYKRGVYTMERPVFKREKIGLHFGRFFLSALISPVRRGYAVDGNHFLNGLITFAIYALLTGMNTYAQTLINMRDYATETEGIAFFHSFLLPIFSTAISLLIISGIIMIVALLMRSGAHYPDIVARFGSLLVIPTVISFFIFIFTLLSGTTTMLFFFVSLLSMISLFSAISFTVYSYYVEGKSGLDPLYAVILTFIGIGFLVFIFKASVFSGYFWFMV